MSLFVWWVVMGADDGFVDVDVGVGGARIWTWTWTWM
jgi:hypothetical protein